MRAPPVRDLRVLACDYDRTLTDLDLVLRDETKGALRRAREDGLIVLVVSGRDAAFLQAAVGDVVDLIVAENGAFLVDPVTGETEELFDEWPTVEELAALGVPLDYGTASANADVVHAERLERAVAKAGLNARLERNVDRIMLLPAGVEKAAGFEAALRRLGVAVEEAAAAGDGENDLSLLGGAGYRIAVANAVPDVKALAHHVTKAEGGDGVREWLEEVWRPARGSSSSPPPRADARRG